MRESLFFLSILQIAHCACPDGFDLVSNGECRGKLKTMDIFWDTWMATTITECAAIQAQPIIIHNEEQQSYWASVAGQSSTKHNNVILGLVCNSTTKQWTWSDGSRLDYKPPNYTSDLDKNCCDGCTWVVEPGNFWGYACGHSGTMNRDIFCTKQLQQVDPDANEGCLYFDSDSDDGVCYQVGENADTWQDAQLNCKKLGANLASIHNTQENSFLRRLAVSNGAVNGLFLGGTYSGKGDNMGWIDGSVWDYENFSPGFPKAGFGECLAMDTFSTAGQWVNIDCGAKLPVACIRNELTIVVPNATCSSNTWKEGQIITSPGFPFSASMPCDFYLTVDSGKRVEVEIILLEANSCCDNLFLFDGYLGGSLLANVTGQVSNVTYTTTSSNIMRVVWEPNGGVNVLGLVMTFRGV
ncbi:hypothetical protein PRIPAC_83091 [Pristionchus pacificus]|nr:hypothetical protein PRIPAC_83091 [Pristionchus pacificus]